MTCPCDDTHPPEPLDLPAGLDDLPRQQFEFSTLRAAMLDRARLQGALADWKARAADDYGVMWLEMQAYVGELLSLYDKAIADESYVRTAKLRPSLRRLLGVLGYVPRPAVAATVDLALVADGKQAVTLPAGTGFRSGGFGAEPPQVFELIAPATIHPVLNRWAVTTPRATTISGSLLTMLLDPRTAQVAAGDVVLVELSDDPADAHVRTIENVARIVDDAGQRVVEVTFDRAIPTRAPVPVAGVRLRKPTRTASLKSPSAVGADASSFHAYYGPGGAWTDELLAANPELFAGVQELIDAGYQVSLAFPWLSLSLDGIYREARAGERMLVTVDGETRWARIYEREEAALTIVAEETKAAYTIVVNGPNNDINIPATKIDAITAPHTRLLTGDYLDAEARKAGPGSATWQDGSVLPDSVTVGVGLVIAGRALGPALRSVLATDPLGAAGARAPIGSTALATRLILKDAEDRGVSIAGGIDYTTRRLVLDPDASWTPGLATPVTAHGNVVTAVRGETVIGEVIGSGDATQVMQHFGLAKKPLTYLAVAGAASDSGVASSLVVWVDGLQWTEVPSFFGQGPDAQVYVVRQDDTGASTITFGDGVRGARLPTGAGNVVASYRWGAGAASPPAGSIAQIAKPVAGLEAVIGPIASGGGADAEGAESLRALAPRSALLLGRAISIEDMEVAARLVPGVTTAKAAWEWDGVRQRPVVKVWIVAGPGVVASVEARLRALTDPDVPLSVAEATPVVRRLAIDLELDPRQVPATVLAAAREALLGEDGWLTPARLGIEQPLLRSPLLAFLLSVPGVTGVRGLIFRRTPLLGYGVDPGPGAYFDFTATTAVTGS